MEEGEEEKDEKEKEVEWDDEDQKVKDEIEDAVNVKKWLQRKGKEVGGGAELQ